MEVALSALAIYVIVVVLFRLAGKRTLSQVTTVDLILLLIISEATQQALLGDDYSIATATIAIVTLVFLDRIADLLKYRFTWFSRIIEGAPVVLVEHGKPLEHRLRKEHISIDDLLTSARTKQGLLRLEQIEYAILESSGGISIIPAESAPEQDKQPERTSSQAT